MPLFKCINLFQHYKCLYSIPLDCKSSGTAKRDLLFGGICNPDEVNIGICNAIIQMHQLVSALQMLIFDSAGLQIQRNGASCSINLSSG